MDADEGVTIRLGAAFISRIQSGIKSVGLIFDGVGLAVTGVLVGDVPVGRAVVGAVGVVSPAEGLQPSVSEEPNT